MGWRDSAACLGADTNLFFPARGIPITGALYYCNKCPVVEACAEYAQTLIPMPLGKGRVAVAGKIGVWGGVSSSMRSDRRTGGSRATRGRTR